MGACSHPYPCEWQRGPGAPDWVLSPGEAPGRTRLGLPPAPVSGTSTGSLVFIVWPELGALLELLEPTAERAW